MNQPHSKDNLDPLRLIKKSSGGRVIQVVRVQVSSML